ncbi:MAG TPA: hypothetical protein VMQ44_03660 [Candidatus Saccharimonadales bacterium]|nr:hypothetical protein [Candidatus Saccharimonadales bacterium]
MKTKKPGSSLLLVMLITAGILTVVFGTQRLALVQFSQSSRDEDNQTAYYAAKAGIEDGLARFRFAHNAETVTGDNNDYTWFDLSNGADLGKFADNNTPSLDPSHEYYGLKVDYRVPTLGNFGDQATWKSIAADGSLDLAGFPNSSSDYYLHYKIKFSQANGAGSPCLAQLQQIRTTDLGVTSYTLVTATPDSFLMYDSAGNNLPIRTSVSGSPALSNVVRIRAVGCSMTVAAQTVTSTGTAANINFDGLTTTVTSTGYFGSTKRTLVAQIDRASGTLLGIYDLTLYGGSGKVGK